MPRPIPSNFDKGVKVYWNSVNRQGGIFGRKVEVVVEDTQSSASVGKDKAKKLVEEDKVFTVVVLDRLENQQAIGAYLDARKVPNIEIQTPANLAKSQTWTFGVTIDHAVQGRLIADYFVNELKAEKVGVVYENTPALSPGRNAFTDEIGKLGAKVAYNRAIDPQANDFSNEALGLKQTGRHRGLAVHGAHARGQARQPGGRRGLPPDLVRQLDLVGLRPRAQGRRRQALAGARAFSPWLPLADPRTDTYQQEYRSQYRRGPRRPRPGRLGRGPDRRPGPRAGRQGPRPERVPQRHAAPEVRARPVGAGVLPPGVREGANVVAVLKQDGDHWALERDFAGKLLSRGSPRSSPGWRPAPRTRSSPSAWC